MEHAIKNSMTDINAEDLGLNKEVDKVLVVDDNTINRRILIALLDEMGIPYDETDRGKEAVKLVRSGKYWLVFIDILMPVMNGLEAIRLMRKEGFKHPIIAVSALAFKQDRLAAFEAGCNEFVSKPIDLNQVSEIIKETKQKVINQPYYQKEQVDNSFTRLETQPTGLSAFLVESDLARQWAYKTIMENLGVTVEVFGSGADTWNYIKDTRKKPHLIISNLQIAEIDGLGLLALVKRTFPTIAFCLYSSQFDADIIQLASQEGADSIIPLKQFSKIIPDIIENQILKSKGETSHSVVTEALQQVRQAQDFLINYGCDPPCQFCEFAYLSLQQAGGDFACCRRFNQENRCGVILMDVAGHDIISSYLSAVFSGILSSHWSQHQHPEDLSRLLNQELCRLGYFNSHVCLSIILWDPIRRDMEITYAGNPGGLIVRQSDKIPEFEQLEGGGMVAGLIEENPAMVSQKIHLPDACTLWFHSDGIASSFLKQAIKNSNNADIKEGGTLNCQSALEQVLSLQGQTDDMMLIKINVPPKPKICVNRFSFNASFDGVDLACQWIETKLKTKTIPENKDTTDIMICVREALLNAVEHGSQSNPEAFIDLVLISGNNNLDIRVSDEGNGFNFHQSLQQTETKDGLQIGSRGLQLMQSTATSIRVDGGSVTMSFNEKNQKG